ncbi:hypothetical protein EG328_005897 [Venturia inaequalis]|uniref:Uncharacterized protein n=1 Tax=Venturia inaequalis TaxID=5025 RepID=A0A8H3VVQ4_VENIN|nr:hypothetical protein EG328_005897 [Venturia inaequalis]KAE9993679.1 hypothetical protein EG327_003943 [Venturia inaequalis]RDI88658.1 hypothetical protein Vi05172_g1030 [Venturia inaequalis]
MADDENKNENKPSGLAGGWIFLIVVIILSILLAAAFFLYLRLTKNKRQSAREAGGFTSSSNPVVAFFKKTISSLRNKRSQTGAGYEGAGYAAPRGGGTGRAAHGGPLDPDEAWDSRVGNESEIYGPGGYYEETELGLHPQSTAYTGAAYGGPAGRLSTDGAGFAPAPGLSAGGNDARGRTSTGENPFGDHAEESSLRSISPRPFEQGQNQNIKKVSSRANSPTGRRSLFKEDIS